MLLPVTEVDGYCLVGICLWFATLHHQICAICKCMQRIQDESQSRMDFKTTLNKLLSVFLRSYLIGFPQMCYV